MKVCQLYSDNYTLSSGFGGRRSVISVRRNPEEIRALYPLSRKSRPRTYPKPIEGDAVINRRAEAVDKDTNTIGRHAPPKKTYGLIR
jgi:hypothetical protein